MADQILTSQRLRELLDYNPETGLFHWHESATQSRRNRGKLAGSMSAGYVRIKADGSPYLAHRLAWLYMHGEWPSFEIDHINGDRVDNRLSNLRDVPQRANMQNRRRARIDNASGILGVKWSERHQKWEAGIRVDGVQIYLGRSAQKEVAGAMYIAAKRVAHRGCTLDPVDM